MHPTAKTHARRQESRRHSAFGGGRPGDHHSPRETGVLRGEKHLFREDRRYQRAAEQLTAICKRECGDSPLFQPADLNVWRYSRQPPSQLTDGSLLVGDTRSIKGEQCRTILRILRDAFAHGNLVTRNNPITGLVFLSRVPDQNMADCLQCDVSTFRNFVSAWAAQIQRLDLENDEVVAGRSFG